MLRGTDGSITPKDLTVSGITAADKVYDGSTAASVNSSNAVFAGLVAGDALNLSASGQFADKNVAAGKTVTLTSSFSGADVGNYRIATQASTTAGINRLPQVSWTGGSTGNWFDPANWAGGAVPDLANVSQVVIPRASPSPSATPWWRLPSAARCRSTGWAQRGAWTSRREP